MPKTLFLSVSHVRDLLGRIGLGEFTRMLAERIEKDFARWLEFDKAPRTASHSPGGVIELMPVADRDRFAFKFVTGHPSNHLVCMPTIMGFGCLADVHSGWALLLSEMTILTAIRTAATSALAARALANPNPKSMALIGNGAQSEFQVIAFHELLGVSSFKLYDIDPDATQRLMDNLCHLKSLELTSMSSIHAASKGSDIVTTSTADKTRASVLTAEMIEPGMHLNAIGGDCPGKTELSPDVLQMSKVFVEFEEQARVEGEIQQMAPNFPVTELWQVLVGARPGRESADEVTLFDSVGFAIEDFSALSLTYELALKHGIGADIELAPEMQDVKNLYGLLQGPL